MTYVANCVIFFIFVTLAVADNFLVVFFLVICFINIRTCNVWFWNLRSCFVKIIIGYKNQNVVKFLEANNSKAR